MTDIKVEYGCCGFRPILKNERTNGQTDGRTDEPTDRQTDKHTIRFLDLQVIILMSEHDTLWRHLFFDSWHFHLKTLTFISLSRCGIYYYNNYDKPMVTRGAFTD